MPMPCTLYIRILFSHDLLLILFTTSPRLSCIYTQHAIESNFGLGSLALAWTALDSLGCRTVDVVLWNPALVVCLLRNGSSSNSWSISANDTDLILGRNSLLGTLR